jgi:hypothetical protein
MLMNGQVVSTSSTTTTVAVLRQAQDAGLSSSTEQSRTVAAEPQAEYKKGN